MSRFLLLLPFLLWMSWSHGGAGVADADAAGLGAFFGFLALLVLVMGLWARLLARRLAHENLQRSLKRFNRTMFAARLAIPAWFALGVFMLGWGPAVHHWLGALSTAPLELPTLLVGTAPAFAAWMGLWWSQYPADRALREQSLLIQLEDNLPVHAPPGFWRYLSANLRLQLLFTVVPVLLILLARDALFAGLWVAGARPADPALLEAGVSLAAAGSVFIFAPEVLRRVLHTQSLPDSPLRRRLEALCARNRLRYRDILLWRTEHNMGNAAVMGVVPRWRYILLSDLLLETMNDAQIEAVFAHEVGHVVHRHMAWFVVFFVILMFAAAGPGEMFYAQLRAMPLPGWLSLDLLMMTLGVATFLIFFGYLSRRFERQADVFAARTMQREAGIVQTSPVASQLLSPIPEIRTPASDPRSYVGQYGASIFASALSRVAVINNIPVAARSWCHGSIAHRMRYLKHLSSDPARTADFDRMMGRVYAALLVVLCTVVAWVAILIW